LREELSRISSGGAKQNLVQVDLEGHGSTCQLQITVVVGEADIKLGGATRFQADSLGPVPLTGDGRPGRGTTCSFVSVSLVQEICWSSVDTE